MKKLGIISVLFIVIIGLGWAIHFFTSQPKPRDSGVSGLIAEGNKFLNIGRYDKAKLLFADALKEEPKNMNADWGMKKVEAKELTSLEKFKQEIDVLRQHDPSDAHINLFMGEYYLSNGDLEKAKTYFDQAISQNPNFAEAHFDLSFLYEQQGNINSAKSEAALAVDIALTPRYHNRLAHVYIKQKHFDAATAEYEKSSEYPLSYIQVAEIYWQRDRLDLAMIRQMQAIQWLNDKNIMEQAENKDPWVFKISPQLTIELTRLEEKKSYAYLMLAFTLHLLDNKEEAEKNIQEMRNLTVARQANVNTVVNASLDALVLEKYSVSTQVDVFKKSYLQDEIQP
ncbi:hypothetical protein DOJK_01489 [Patescibacteria group bacterium]|nr:hypothetical protein DOJK_01489 [Patescibacteria group bacterium]